MLVWFQTTRYKKLFGKNAPQSAQLIPLSSLLRDVLFSLKLFSLCISKFTVKHNAILSASGIQEKCIIYHEHTTSAGLTPLYTVTPEPFHTKDNIEQSEWSWLDSYDKAVS